MNGMFTVPMLVARFKHYSLFGDSLFSIKHILTHSCTHLGKRYYLPKNMRQRMADLLQLELVKLKLL